MILAKVSKSFAKGFAEIDNNRKFQQGEESRPHAFKEGSLLAARAEKVFSSKEILFFVFSIPGVPHTYGNCQSKVSQFSSQTPHCWSKHQSLRGNKQRKGKFIKQSISLKVKFCSYRRWKYQGMSY